MTEYEKCLDDVKNQRGTYPYNGFNLVKGDGYFAKSIEEKYPKTMIQKAVKECKEIEQKIKAACDSCLNTKEEESMGNLKIVEEYSMEMTREEFDKFTEQEDICPRSFSLKDFGEDCNGLCNVCWNDALIGITFKAAVPTLPKETLPILKTLGELEVQSKKIKEQQETLKIDLLNAMESHGVKKWDNEVMTISYVASTTKTSVDSKKLKEELPDVFSKYSKTSKVKSSIRIKLKEDK